MITVHSKRRGGQSAPPGAQIIPACRPHLLGNPYPVAPHGWPAAAQAAAAPLLHDPLVPERLKAALQRAAQTRGLPIGFALWAYAHHLARDFTTGGPLSTELRRHAARPGDLSFECWCAPAPCHADLLALATQALRDGTDPIPTLRAYAPQERP